MANEFKVKNALKILNSHPITGIYDASSAFNGDSSTNESLGTINATQKYTESFIYNKSFIDGSLSIRDTSLGNLSRWNVTQDGSLVNLRTYVDGSLATRDTSLGNLSRWNVTQDASIVLKADLIYIDGSLVTRDGSIEWLFNNPSVTQAYVDGSLATRDTSLGNLSRWNVTQDGSLVNLRTYVDGSLAVRDGSINYLFENITPGDVTKAYVDGSLSVRDGSIVVLFTKNINQDSSINFLNSWNLVQDASIVLKASNIYVDGSLATRDTSLGNLSRWNVTQDSSLVNLRTYVDGSLSTRDTSLGNLSRWNVTQDGSLVNLRTYVDGSLSTRDTSLGNLSRWNVTQDASIVLKASKIYVDGSLSYFIRSASTGTTLYWTNGLLDVSNYVSRQYVDASLSAISVVINDNIFDWDSSNKWYAPYSSKQSGLNFYIGSASNPDDATRLNLNGVLYATQIRAIGINNQNSISGAGMGTSGSGIYGSTYLGTGVKAEITGGGTGVPVALQISNGYILSGNNISGALLNVTDDPSLNGFTSSHKIITVAISGVEKFKVDPRVLDTSSAVAYILDTLTNLTQTGAKIVTVKNAGSVKFYIDKDGNTNIPSGATYKIGEIGMYTNTQIDAAINAALVGQQTFSAIYAFNNFI